MKLRGSALKLFRLLFHIAGSVLPVSRGFMIKRLLLRLSGVQVGPNVAICGGAKIHGYGSIRIDEGVWLSANCHMYCGLGGVIEIGANCDVGPEVSLVTGSHEIGDQRRRAGRGLSGAIRVQAGCWVGARCTIVAGASLGRGCVVGAGALVREAFPENVMIAGVPAKIRKKI